MKFQCCQLLRKQFLQLKKVDGISLREFSDSIDLSPTYVSLILNSKRLPNMETLKKLAEHLEMDHLAFDQLKDAYQLDWLKKKNIKATLIKKNNKSTSDGDVEVTLMEDTNVFKSWLNLALSEFTLCDAFTEDAQKLAQIFSVSPSEVKEAFHWLTVSGFLERNIEGVLQKKYKKIRFPVSHRSRMQMRNFHKQMILKAVRHMELNTEQEAYQRRLINGYTVAVNSEKIEEAKILLQKSLAEVAELLSHGASDAVYQLQVQFFPLTKKPD